MFTIPKLQKSNKPLSSGMIIIGTRNCEIELIVPESETKVIPVSIGENAIDSIAITAQQHH